MDVDCTDVGERPPPDVRERPPPDVRERPSPDVREVRRNTTFELPKILHQFVEETGIFVCHLLRRRLSCVEKVFWLLCTLFLGFYTIRDVVKISAAFLREDTVSLTSKRRNATITIDPPPTFIFAHGMGTLEFREPVRDDRLAEMLSKFLAEFQANEVPRMDRELLELTIAMFQCVTNGEIQAAFRHKTNYSFEWAAFYKDRANFEKIKSAVKMVYKRFHAERVDFARLMKVVACNVCTRFYFNVTRTQLDFEIESISYTSPCEPQNIVLFGGTYIGFKLTQEAITFTEFEEYDYVRISWDSIDDASSSHRVLFDVSGITQTTTDQEEADTLLKIPYTKTGERAVVSMRITAEFRLAEEKTPPCSKTMSRYDCKRRCDIDNFMRSCPCYPLFFTAAYKPIAEEVMTCPYYSREGDVASDFVDYLISCKTLNTSELQDWLTSCYERCSPTCHTKALLATVEREQRPNSTRDELQLVVKSFAYLLIEERLAISWDSFVSQLGGILGIYLGISFSVLIHIPTFLSRKVVEYCRTKCELKESMTPNAIEMNASRQCESCSSVSFRFDSIDRRLRVMEERLQRACKEYECS